MSHSQPQPQLTAPLSLARRPSIPPFIRQGTIATEPEQTTVIIVHRWGGSPYTDWYQSAKDQLTCDGARVLVLEMPEPNTPNVDVWPTAIAAAIANNNVALGPKTYLVGHSTGCQAVLRYLAQIGQVGARVGGVLLVAVWFTIDKPWPAIEPWITTPLDLASVRLASSQFRGMVSDNDPYTADHVTTTKHFISRLSGGLAPVTMQMVNGAKHFNDNQPSVITALRSLIGVIQSGDVYSTPPSRTQTLHIRAGSLPGSANNSPLQETKSLPNVVAATATASAAATAAAAGTIASAPAADVAPPVDPWAPQPCPYTPMSNVGPGRSGVLAIGKWPAPSHLTLDEYTVMFKKYIFDHLIKFPQLLNYTLGVDTVANCVVGVTSWTSWEEKESATSGPLWRDQIMSLVKAAGGGPPPLFVHLPVYCSFDEPAK